MVVINTDVEIDTTLTREDCIDLIAPVKEIRAAAHGLAFNIATGESPTTEPGWQRSTCLAEYDQLDLIGKLGVRLMPAGFGGLLAGTALNAQLYRPTGWVWIPVAYLVFAWVVLVAYDPAMGVLELARNRRGDGE